MTLSSEALAIKGFSLMIDYAGQFADSIIT
jgi:hypothetical protein